MSIQLEVWGDYALFTRPEMKVERVSYDIMTPSAARGLVEAHLLASWAEVDHRPHPCVRSHPLHQPAAQRGQVHSLRPLGPDGDGAGQGRAVSVHIRRHSAAGRPAAAGMCGMSLRPILT